MLYTDGCKYNPAGIVCKMPEPGECDRCGWNPTVELKRREIKLCKDNNGTLRKFIILSRS